jgi:hypothetical protein
VPKAKRKKIAKVANNVAIYGDFMQIPEIERSLFIDPIPEDNT